MDGLDGAALLAISPDGEHVYVTGQFDDAVAVFSRDDITGSLTFVEVQKDGVGGVDGLNAAAPVTVSPDGVYVFVTGFDDDAVVVFSRDPSTGALTFLEMQTDGVGGVDGLDGAQALATTPNSKCIYVGSFFDDALGVFRVDD